MSSVKVVKDNIHPDDIYQGKIADCYFLSAISALAENPSRVQRLLITKDPNHKHAYGVLLNYCGDWKLIDLDDYFPTVEGKLFFCHTKSAEIWCMLLEKAYAKMFGGYWNIGRSCFADEAMKDLTGAPCEYLEIDDTDRGQVEALWKKFEYWWKNKYVVVTGTKGKAGADTTVGLLQGHGYTFLKSWMLAGERVVELRDSWADSKWNGDWGYNSGKWNQSLRTAVSMDAANPQGRFFMPFKDYIRFFEQISVCYYEEAYVLSSFTSELESEFIGCFKFKAGSPGKYYVSLSQVDADTFPVSTNERKSEF